MRVTAQLIDRRERLSRLAETYNCTHGKRVLDPGHDRGRGRARPGPGAGAGLDRRGGSPMDRNAEAYAFYLRGRRRKPIAIWRDRNRRSGNGTRSVLAVDPEYAPALAGLAVRLIREWVEGVHVSRKVLSRL